MPFEKGGRADKNGNEYEKNSVIYELLKVVNERNYSVVMEPLGEDEIGTDMLVTTMDGQKVHQQCKARNGSKEFWDFSDLNARKIFSVWKVQLDRNDCRNVALVSPMACSFLVDLHERASNTSGKAEDFYYAQIMNSGKDFQRFYRNFCTAMELEYSKEADVLKSIDYLKRIFYKQMSGYELEEHIEQSIRYLFSSERDRVYNALVSFVKTENVLGMEITQQVLFDYFKKQKLVLRLMEGDRRSAPRIHEMNQEYRGNFKSLQGGLVHRKEFDDCIAAIEKERNLIISGAAGYGKSGCTEAILDYCEERKLPHLAIKLDRRIPHGNCDVWGQELGFPGSVVYSLNCISRNENAVIILDQLDALRWTQTNSSEAIAVCMELIRQVKYLNYEREKKIIIVFVCRTYDLENDPNIGSLFKKEKTSEEEWEIVNVKEFDESDVKTIVGEDYEGLSVKLKRLLKIPGNIYIWQHLDREESYGDCSTTSHLIIKWFEQIVRKSIEAGLQSKDVNEAKLNIVNALEKRGRLFIPKIMLNVGEAELDYLISSEMIVLQNNKVGFVHQSILDYFVSENMVRNYYDGQTVEMIIGEKSRQDPSRRYQVQMFLQSVLEADSGDFIQVGEQMLLSDHIRYYVKYLFYEIMGQIEEPDDNITQFVLDNCEHRIYGEYLLYNTILGKKQYVSVLRDQGILERWYLQPERKEAVFNLLASIAPNLDNKDISFIRKYAFIDEKDDKQFLGCFFHDIHEESEELFELRMLFYEHYPEYGNIYINVSEITGQYTKRIVRLLSFWLKNEMKSQGRNVYSCEELSDLDNSFLADDYELVLKELLPYIPMENNWIIENGYGDWSGDPFNKRNLERGCVELIKKATMILCKKVPALFWEYYEPYLGKGYYVFNEIILTGLASLPEQYSNQVIRYFCKDLDDKVFDYTSGAEDQLGLAGNVLKIHGKTCNQEILEELENVISHYISPYACEWYKYRIKRNRKKEYFPVYWSYWGDLQYKLLQCIPKERLTQGGKNLLQVLERRFCKEVLRYNHSDSHWGGVKSPVTGKKIGKVQWLQIITNNKLKEKEKSGWNANGFIESSWGAYADDLRKIVKENPQEMVELILENKDRVLSVYIDSVFEGLEISERLNEIEFTTLEKFMLSFPYDMESHRASYFCRIIEKADRTDWCPEIFGQLIEIGLKHRDPKLGMPNVTNDRDEEMKSCLMLRSNAWNCVRGRAAAAIAHLLWEDEKLFLRFQDTIDRLVQDENPAVRFASMEALWPSYNISKEWTEEKIMYLYESDIRMAGFYDSKNMFFRLYPRYGERVLNIVKNCFESEDEELVKVGGYAVCEFYIQYNEFAEIMNTVGSKSEEQITAILDMVIVYMGVEEYREKAKAIILSYKDVDVKVENSLSRIFYDEYVDCKRDREFLLEFMKTLVSRRVVRAFVHYLEKNAVSVVSYADIIFQLCENILQIDSAELRKQWGLEEEVSKLIITLYDETANSDIIKEKKIAAKCLDLWYIMFEKQLNSVRKISRKLMER